MRVSSWQSGVGRVQPRQEGRQRQLRLCGEGHGGTGTHGGGGLTRSSGLGVVGAPREWGLWGPLEGSITLLWGWVWPQLNLLCLVWSPTSGALPRLQGKAPAWLCGCSSGWALMVLSHLISF